MKFIQLYVCLFVCLMVFNATFNNISVITAPQAALWNVGLKWIRTGKILLLYRHSEK